jgi:hypothetical protein
MVSIQSLHKTGRDVLESVPLLDDEAESTVQMERHEL